MSAINSDQSRSGVPEIIDSGLTAGIEPNKKKPVLSKGDSRYWLIDGRMFKNHKSAEYACRFTALKRREHFPLGTQNKKSAASKAAEIYTFIQTHGWDAALKRYKPETSHQTDSSCITVGQFIEVASKVCTARRQSIDAYTKAIRKIVSEIKPTKGGKKHNGRSRGASEWRKMSSDN